MKALTLLEIKAEQVRLIKGMSKEIEKFLDAGMSSDEILATVSELITEYELKEPAPAPVAAGQVSE